MKQNITKKIAEEGVKASLEIGAVSMAIGFHLEALFISALVIAGGFLYLKNIQDDLTMVVGGSE